MALARHGIFTVAEQVFGFLLRPAVQRDANTGAVIKASRPFRVSGAFSSVWN